MSVAGTTFRITSVTHRFVYHPTTTTSHPKAHIWQNKRQLYLGSFSSETEAAVAYDKAAIKLNRNTDLLNFPISNYASQLEHLARTSKEELIVELRRESAGFARGTSSYRGVSWRASTKRFEARIGRLLGKKYTYLGTYTSGEAAARAYDRAAIVSRGRDAVTNFHLSEYEDLLRVLEAATPQQRRAMEEEIARRTDEAVNVGASQRRRKSVASTATTTATSGGGSGNSDETANAGSGGAKRGLKRMGTMSANAGGVRRTKTFKRVKSAPPLASPYASAQGPTAYPSYPDEEVSVGNGMMAHIPTVHMPRNAGVAFASDRAPPGHESMMVPLYAGPMSSAEDKAMTAKMHRDSRRAKRSLRRSKSSSVATSTRRWSGEHGADHCRRESQFFGTQWEPMESDPLSVGASVPHAHAFDPLHAALGGERGIYDDGMDLPELQESSLNSMGSHMHFHVHFDAHPVQANPAHQYGNGGLQPALRAQALPSGRNSGGGALDMSGNMGVSLSSEDCEMSDDWLYALENRLVRMQVHGAGGTSQQPAGAGTKTTFPLGANSVTNRSEPRFTSANNAMKVVPGCTLPYDRQMATLKGKLPFLEDVVATFDEFDRLHAAEFGNAASAARV